MVSKGMIFKKIEQLTYFYYN